MAMNHEGRHTVQQEQLSQLVQPEHLSQEQESPIVASVVKLKNFLAVVRD